MPRFGPQTPDGGPAAMLAAHVPPAFQIVCFGHLGTPLTADLGTGDCSVMQPEDQAYRFKSR